MSLYTLNEIMTIHEAAERYNVNLETLKCRFKVSIVGQDKLNALQESGLIKQSGKTWLLTPEFMEIILKTRRA